MMYKEWQDPQLKLEQLDAITVHDGKDVFMWFPTRFGKPACYELLLSAMGHK